MSLLKVKVVTLGWGTETPQNGVGVTFSTTTTPPGGAGASVDPASDSTDLDGVAETALTLGSSTGTYEAAASCVSCANPTYRFTAVAKSTPQASVLEEVFCGGSQFVGQPLKDPLMVRVYNPVTKEPVFGWTVNFTTVTVPAGSAGYGLSPGAATTDSEGVARSLFTVGTGTGSYVVQAVCPDCQSGGVVTCEIGGILAPDLAPPSAPVVSVKQRRTGFNVTAFPSEVAPVIPPDQALTAYNNSAAILVTGAGVSQLGTGTVEAQPASGGHQHDYESPKARPAGSVYPSLFASSSGGTASTVFVSTTIGGQEYVEIEFESPAGQKTRANAKVPIRIPGLERLPGPTTYYLQSQSEQGAARHPVNNYGTSYLVQQLQKLAELWRVSNTAAPLSILSFNDLSLIDGGVFDLSLNWKEAPIGHLCHRQGTSVDLNRTVRTVTEKFERFENLGNLIDEILDANPGIVDCRRVTEKLIVRDVKNNIRETICNVHYECPATARCQQSAGVTECTYKIEKLDPNKP